MKKYIIIALACLVAIAGIVLFLYFNRKCDQCEVSRACHVVGDLDLCEDCYKDAKALMSFDK